MAFVTEDDARATSTRIALSSLGIGPYLKRNYVSHVNTRFPGMLKAIFRLLILPPVNVFDCGQRSERFLQ
jgi:hypothetical protein